MGGRLYRGIDWEQLAIKSDFKPAKFARLCTISKRHLERHFVQEFRQTPKFWLRTLQCRMAKELIASGHSNKMIAADLKSASAAHFCRVFKKYCGISPGQFAQMREGSPKCRVWT